MGVTPGSPEVRGAPALKRGTMRGPFWKGRPAKSPALVTKRLPGTEERGSPKTSRRYRAKEKSRLNLIRKRPRIRGRGAVWTWEKGMKAVPEGMRTCSKERRASKDRSIGLIDESVGQHGIFKRRRKKKKWITWED